MFTDLSYFIQFRPINVTVQILNGGKAAAKGFVSVIIRVSNTDLIIPLWPVYYMPDNPQNTISQPAIKFYNKFRSVRTEALRWIQFVQPCGKKTRTNTMSRQRDEQLLDFLQIDIITGLLPQHQQQTTNSVHLDSTYPLMSPQACHSFSETPLTWELLHRRLLHPSDHAMDAMCRLQ